MIARFRQLASAFAVVLGAYLAYSLAAVPLIEPSVQQRKPLVTDRSGMLTGSAARLRAAQLESLFQPGSWELDSPTVLETDLGMLLIQDYAPLADGRLELKPCTVILYTSADRPGAEKKRRCVVLEAPEGAVLRSDQPINLARGEFGRLEGGRLIGPVTIRSPESRPGASDALLLRTRDVEISPDRIVAPHEIAFRYGKHYGSGRDLIISMEQAERPGSGSREGKLPVGRLESLELVHVREIHLELADPAIRRQGDGHVRTGTAKTTAQVVVTCKGPFRYDFQRQLATFRDHVVIVRANARGPNDRLDCQWLAVHLSHRSGLEGDTASPASGLPDMSHLEVERIEARGRPAVLRAPSYSASARGELLEYDFRTRRVRIEDANKVTLWYHENQFEAPRLEYRFGEDGRLGVLRAAGPGRIRGSLPDDAQHNMFEAMWNDRLIIQPDQGDHALSLISGAVVRYYGEGEFAADNIHVWLREVPRPEGAPDKASGAAVAGAGNTRVAYEPVRMLAEGTVRIDSWQLSGRTQKTEVWIRREDPVGRDGHQAPADMARAPAGTTPPLGAARFAARGHGDRPKQKFDLACRSVQLQLLRRDGRLEVERLIVEGDVVLREIQVGGPGYKPLEVRGDVVQVDHANAPDAKVRVRGSEARVAARGLAVRGTDIQMMRAGSRVEIPGPGSMILTPDARAGPLRPPAGGASPASGPITVEWQGRMEFDGRVAKFLDDVRVQARQSTRRGELLDLLVMGHQLDATLNHRLDLSRQDQDAELDLQSLVFRGEVLLQNRTSERGGQTSFDQMQVRDLSLDRASGRLHAFGPGWGSSVRFRKRLRAEGADAHASTADAQDAQLVYVRVRFEDEMVGNMETRQIECRGRVETVYGPVVRWDATLDSDPPEGPGPGVFLLTSDRLALAESETHGSDAHGPAVELLAEGDATIEGKGFTARGQRISYAQAKDLFILEGDGRNDAQIWFQGSSTPDAAAQQIRFWPRTRSLQVDGGRMLNLTPVAPGT